MQESGHLELPAVVTSCYLGMKTEDRNRPICVTFNNPNIGQLVIANAHRLKFSTSYKRVYVSPQRSEEDQKTHNELVKQLKEKINGNPSRFWFIRDGTVQSREHKVRTRSTNSSSTAEKSRHPGNYIR